MQATSRCLLPERGWRGSRLHWLLDAGRGDSQQLTMDQPKLALDESKKCIFLRIFGKTVSRFFIN
jgi:hypothetical protein